MACVVFEPGDAHMSKQTWCDFTWSSATGTMLSMACRVHAPRAAHLVSHVCKPASAGSWLALSASLEMSIAKLEHHGSGVNLGKPPAAMSASMLLRHSSPRAPLGWTRTVTGSGLCSVLMKRVHSEPTS